MKSKNHNIDHGEISFIKRDNEVIIVHNEKEIASLHLETMEYHGDSGIKPTENFWLIFNAKEMSDDKNIADVWINDPKKFCDRVEYHGVVHFVPSK